MELKRFCILWIFKYLTLLIVPYGIETRFRLFLPKQQYLLIVPYGIETFESFHQVLPPSFF